MRSPNKPPADLLTLPETGGGAGKLAEKIALARWENDGGPDSSEAVTLAADEADILHALGSGVLALWSDLPTSIQRELFNSALAGKKMRNPVKVKWQIARFLHLRAQGTVAG